VQCKCLCAANQPSCKLPAATCHAMMARSSTTVICEKTFPCPLSNVMPLCHVPRLSHRAQPGTWQHMFPGRLRPCHLTALNTAGNSPWQGPDLDRLASSCMGLRVLHLRCSRGLQLTALLHLPALTQLCLEGITEAITMASLARLQGLEALGIMEPCRIDDHMLVVVAALAQLTLLLLPSSGVFSPTMQQQLRRAGQQLDYNDDSYLGAGWYFRNKVRAPPSLCVVPSRKGSPCTECFGFGS